jgi:purine-nucleoside phosphorylase
MSEPKHEMMQQIEFAVNELRKITESKPTVGIILGTGLGKMIEEIAIECAVNYNDIPHFPLSTVESHTGRLIFGKIGGKSVVAMQGRMHYYEGYSMRQITFPVRVMKYLGIETLLVSNACGSLNPYIRKGELMIIDDHINLLGDNPLIGANDDRIGPRFPDMSEPYSKKLIELAEDCARELKIKVKKGVFSAMTGPSLETRAEYRFLRNAGADVIGMSTIPENIVARHMGLKVLGMSIITDECYPDSLRPVSLDEILDAAGKAEPDLTAVMKAVIEKL